MNLRNVLRAYSLLRQLSDDESALLETLRQTNDAERALLVETLADKPQKKPGKAAGKRAASKSSRATQLGDTIRSRAQQKVIIADGDGLGDDARCEFVRADGKACKLLPDHNIHHLATANEYHPFVSSAQPADNPSSASSAATSSGASFETGKAAASNVHHAASGSD